MLCTLYYVSPIKINKKKENRRISCDLVSLLLLYICDSCKNCESIYYCLGSINVVKSFNQVGLGARKKVGVERST